MALKTVGLTGRNYATLAAYASYANALALTAPEVFEVYNDGGAVADTAAVTINGYTGSSSTNTITGRAATGQGFRDNANILTNPLRYNAANGAAFTSNVTSVVPYVFGDNFILDGLQFKNTDAAPGAGVRMGAGSTFRNGIIDTGGAGYAFVPTAANVTLENSILHCRGSANGIDVQGTASGLVITDCLVISPAASGGRGLHLPYATGGAAPLIKNTVVYGFTNDFQNTGNASCTNNATSLSAFAGTNWGTAGQVSVTSAEWVSLTSGSEDFTVAAGSAKLKGNGATVGPTVGIRGNARSAPYTIGPDQVAGTSTPSATISYTEANDTSAITANVTVGSPSATISYTEANDTSAITGNVTISGGTLTTGAFKNNTGSVLASLTGLTVTVLLASTLAFVKSFASQTTNGSGVMSITDPLFIAGTVYAVVTTNAPGTLGVEKYTAA